MAMFDFLSDTITQLGKDIFGNDLYDQLPSVDSALNIVKGGAKALGNLNNAEEKKSSKENQLYELIRRDSSKMGVDEGGKYKTTKVPYGLPNYSVSPEDIEGKWAKILNGYAQSGINPRSSVSKYIGE